MSAFAQGIISNANIANVSTGIYQMDLTGVSFTALSGGTDDFGVFGLRGFLSSSITGFWGTRSSSSNQAVIVFGNESTYAMILGACALGFTIYRRRRTHQS